MPKRSTGDEARAEVRSVLRGFRRAARRKDPPAELLRELLDQTPAPGAALGWLAAYDEDPALRESAVMMLFVAARDPSVPSAIGRPILRAAGPVLSRAFRDPAVDDEIKYVVGPMLSLCGLEVEGDAYSAAFRDHEAIHRRRAKEALQDRPATPEAVEECLETWGLSEPETILHALDMARHALEDNPSFGALLLVTISAIAHEQGADLDPVVALRAAAATRTGAARWVLRIAAELPCMGSMGAEAERLAAQLEAAGVAEEVPETGAFDRGLLSIVDGMGSRQVVLLYRRGSRRDCLTLMPNDEVGIKDAFCVYEHGREVLRAFREQPDIATTACDLTLARAVVANALAIHERTGRAVPGRFLLYRHFLGQQPLVPAEREPDLSAYRLEDLVVGPELVARTQDLAHRPDCRDFYCASDRAYGFVEEHVTYEGDGDGDRIVTLTDRDLARFIAGIAIEEKEILVRRLAANLEVEALAGRAARSGNRRLARLWLGLLHDVVPFAQVPFVRELTRIGIENILENVLQGFHTQADVNAAAMEDGSNPY